MKLRVSILAEVTIIIVMVTLIIGIHRYTSIETLGKIIPISSVKTKEKVVAIAINVYEGEEELNNILKALDDKNIKVSFFLGGVWVKNNSNTILRMKKSGHDIQNHGYYHRLPSTLSKENNIKEIINTERLIYSMTGVRTNLFEPPSGDFNEFTLDLVNSMGYKTITWSIDTIDWRSDATRELILRRIKNKLHPGGIILMHPKPVSAASIEEILNYIHGEGYRITTVTNLINMR